MGGYSFDLTGRTVLVTGASSGIGRHFAKKLARSGARVALAARRIEALESLRAEIEADGGIAVATPMDVADEASTIAAYDAIEAAIGPVDSVIANAGVSSGKSALGMDIDEFDRIVAINQRGVFLTAREGARRMIKAGSAERGHGRIVIISSVTAWYTSAHTVTYSATKAAVTQMGRTMALDWANKGVNVNVVCPGYMRTELTDDFLSSDKGQALLDSFPRRRLMDIDVLDPTVLFLCSDASAQITGSVFAIDDGQTL
ncbi:SDR family NAD(P)-dependent oxidoreductase [Sphingomonas crocodyli]|uniref:SDR family NAD(P)-dependent oxidoreductase n=1 Tax=Sphingomonas crocodyli TaxID=1979270 RepID=A0A437M996_9SPHN|nr:SDR family NAD(P)-dependent oxidoreductase [Sphingomonas crocodyli]RVT94219.1 SDR family NAD(P)-dependent oxidoreductase [Sphingomonas crocodyli]